jgi:transposase, IS5 family
MVPDKILSFHLNEVCCFTKNKPGKKYQFGRVFQLARIKGNFLFSGKCPIPNISDKKSVQLMLNEHRDSFSDTKIQSASTDKGYYSIKNEKIMSEHGVTEIGIQRPDNIKKSRISPLPRYREEELIDRRAGIEPLIGHAKHKGQLGRSRMKSDKTIKASGFASILGFNLRQLIRYKIGKITLEAT